MARCIDCGVASTLDEVGAHHVNHHNGCPQIDYAATLGKRVTLALGVVVTDRGASVVNGYATEALRTVQADDGWTTVVLARVMRDLPETIRREDLWETIHRDGWR